MPKLQKLRKFRQTNKTPYDSENQSVSIEKSTVSFYILSYHMIL
jgi:hypothetical protein